MIDTHQLIEHFKEELSKARREALNANLLLIETQRALAQVKQQRDESQGRRDELLKAKTKPEPSRLEIAAIILSGLAAGSGLSLNTSPKEAIWLADALIAEAARKEVAK